MARNVIIIVLRDNKYDYNSKLNIELISSNYTDYEVRLPSFDIDFKIDNFSLEGKRLILSISCGAPLDAFKEGGFQNYTIEDLTKGFHQLANLCSMKWDGFIVTGGLTFFLKDKPEEMKKMHERLEKHAEEISAKIKSN